ncbi:valine--tRNA ligase [bacterium]|nr:valine--tRNA ligase [bacterium]
MKELQKRFEFSDQENIYNMWEKGEHFKPKGHENKKPFTIIMPPPNANGSLHIGHAVFVTLEDIMVRYHRMLQEPTLWLPGADHAGIQTQVVFEKKLKKAGKSRYDLGREEFYKQTYEFTMDSKKVMENQLRRLGASCDWSREHFTLEPEISKSVFNTFKKLYEDDLIYRDKRIINWCPRCATALSDIEVIYEEMDASLTYIKYPIKDSKESIIVATTRPETMLGDTAIAVNPQDKRYKKLIGKTAIVPIANREIPIIADKKIDIEFGTGAVKVTPSHDPNDFELAQKYNLEFIEVIDKVRKITKNGGKEFEGLKTNEARDKIIDKLKQQNLITKIDDLKHSVGTCERCKTIVEPLVSMQWFVKIKPLADKAIKAVKSGEVKFHPKKFEKVYYNWMDNIRDWCISRQIWWGHRIPVYYCDDCNKIMVEIEKPKKCKCGSTKVHQDEDTLDTWFSSGQWPYTTLGWDKKNPSKDYKQFYPTQVMETGFDILFFWVARMIMLGLYTTGQVPFKDVVLHGLVRDKDKVKMSKSRGNVIDPLGVVEDYGADALRMALVFGTGIGNDIVVSEEKIRGMRNFATKIWNASRFVLSNIDKETNNIHKDELKLTKEDKWILDEHEKTIQKVTKALNTFQFHQAAETIYDFFWHKFCDKAIENTKKRIYEGSGNDKKTAQWVLLSVLQNSLKMLHPFMPFVTEAIWEELDSDKPLIISHWPK